MSLARSLRLASLLPLVLLVTPLTAAAQFSSALQGTISDTQQAFVPDAIVRVTNTTTGVTREVATSADGVYRVPSLGAGVYTVEIEKTGFLKARRENLRLGISETLRLDFTLDPGALEQSITVSSEGAIVKTDSSTVSTVINRQFVENLPLNGRSFQTLIALTPGVVMTKATFGEQGQFSVNGQRANANYFTVDGVSANFGLPVFEGLAQSGAGALPGTNIQGGFGNLTSVDALQEFRIQTSSFAPEFGRSPGAQISLVTRSGENHYRGSLYEYFRNDVLDARDFFDAKKPPLRFNNFGGTFSGPVILPHFGTGGSPVWRIGYLLALIGLAAVAALLHGSDGAKRATLRRPGWSRVVR